MEKKDIEKAAQQYAHHHFNMHETNNYKALVQGFEAGARLKILELQQVQSELTQLKAENEILKSKITKIRNELLASKLCNDFEVDRIFAENKAHWNNDLSESPYQAENERLKANMTNRIEHFITTNRKICWEAEYENGEFCIGENKLRKLIKDLTTNP
jgi:hypothetical protein